MAAKNKKKAHRITRQKTPSDPTPHLKVTVLAEQQVLRLEVAVGHRHLVQVLQGEDDAAAEEGGHLEVETSEGRLGNGRVPLVYVRPEQKNNNTKRREKSRTTI